MKRILLLLALCVSALTVNASTGETLYVRLAQPTIVGEATLPAGEYTVHVLRPNGDTPVLAFQGKDKAALVIATQTPLNTESTAAAELVLSRTGDQFKLLKVIVNGRIYEVPR